MFRKLLVWSSPLFLAAAVALAQAPDQSKDLKEMQKQATRLDKEASQGQDAVFDSLSKQLNMQVATLQAEQKSTNFGVGQLFIANSLAAASGKTFDQIAQEFKSGRGWGEIARENNVNLGKVVSDLRRANNQVAQDRTERTQASASGGSSRATAGSNANANAGANPQATSRGVGPAIPRKKH